MSKIIITFSLAFVFTCVALLQIDDDINPDAEAVYQAFFSIEENEGFYYLLGIQAPIDQSPEQFGRSIYAKAKYQEDHMSSGSPLTEKIMVVKQEGDLRLPEGELFCLMIDDVGKCEQQILSYSEEVDKVLETHAVLLSRYREFIKMSGYKTMTKPYVFSPMPLYQYLSKGSRLLILSALRQAHELDLEGAVDLITQNISDLRRHMGAADNLIAKIVYMSLVSENLNFLSLLVNNNSYSLSEKLVEFTDAERSMLLPFNSEFSHMYVVLDSMDGQPYFWSENVYTPVFLTRMVYKRNMSINQIYPRYAEAINRSELSANSFRKMVEQGFSDAALPFNARNIAGHVINEVGAGINFDRYIGRMNNLAAKVTLFNAIHIDKKRHQLEQIANPYYPNSKYAYMSEDKKRVCFDSPVKSKEKDRCLSLSF